MKKVIVAGLAVVILIAGVVMIMNLRNREPAKNGRMGQSGVVVEMGNSELVEGKKSSVEIWVDVKDERVSVVSILAEAKEGIVIEGFDLNKENFNSVMQSSISGNSLKFDAVAMKATKDLPTGKFLLGNMMVTASKKGEVEVEFKKFELVAAAKEGGDPKEIKMVPASYNLKVN